MSSFNGNSHDSFDSDVHMPDKFHLKTRAQKDQEEEEKCVQD